MSIAIQQCPNDNDPEDICERLGKEINDLINRDKRQHNNCGTHGLIHRFREQIQGANGPGTAVWSTHDETIRAQQRGLRNRLNDFNRNNCGSKVKIPDDSWNWATRPAPKPEEWKGPTQREMIEPEPAFTDFEYWERVTGLTGAALVVYLIVSEGSRILFPPRNLVPVP